MSLAPSFRPGQRVWQIACLGRRKPAVHTLEITEIIHHYAITRRLTGCLIVAGQQFERWAPAEPFDCRTAYDLLHSEAEARLELALCTHPLGSVAAGLLRCDPADGKARRASEWGAASDQRTAAPQKIAAALRLLVRCGRAERLPRPKRGPRYRLLPAPVPPLPESLLA